MKEENPSDIPTKVLLALVKLVPTCGWEKQNFDCLDISHIFNLGQHLVFYNLTVTMAI